jgi:hypothetical protein
MYWWIKRRQKREAKTGQFVIRRAARFWSLREKKTPVFEKQVTVR